MTIQTKRWERIKCSMCGHEQMTISDKPICSKCKSKRMYLIDKFSDIAFDKLEKDKLEQVQTMKPKNEKIEEPEEIEEDEEKDDFWDD